MKPDNILFSGGQAVVADFGIAKALSAAGGADLTRTGLFVGTPRYMSPEQAGDAGALDARSDLYSLACVCYRMLVGEAPFTGSNAASILARHAVDPVAPPSTVRPGLPKAVDRVLEKALAKSPADRYRTVEAFADALARAAAVDVRAELRRARRRRWALVAGAVAAVAAIARFGLTGVEGLQNSRVAVLPVNAAGDLQGAFLADAVHGALISELTQVGFTVVGRNSVLRYADGTTPTGAISEELSVEAVVESTLLPDGDGLSLLASLVDGGSEAVVWTGAFDADARSVLTLMRTVADSIAGGAGLDMTAEVTARRAATARIDPNAYEALLRGTALLGNLTPAGLDSAMALFEEALSVEPELAGAYAGIANVWGYRQQMGIVPPYEAAPEAHLAATEAVRLDSLSAAGQANRAIIAAWQRWEWAEAEDAFGRALAIDPGDARTRAFYAHFLAIVGRPQESAAQIDSALALDPLDPMVQGLRAANLMLLERHDEALAQADEVLEISPGMPLALIVRRAVYGARGMYEEAFEAARTETAARGDTELVEAFDRGWEAGGYAAAMRAGAELQAARSERMYVAPSQVYELYFAAGMIDEAVAWLERGVDRRDPQMPYLSVSPFLGGLRDDPRIERLIRRMQYPPPPSG